METGHKELTTLTFEGRAFADHGIEVECFPELAAYKRIVVSLAEEFWRRENPDRQRLPRGFADNIRLKAFRLEVGSVSVPLKREIMTDDKGQVNHVIGAEVESAIPYLEAAIDKVEREGVLPDDFPNNVIPLFDAFGRTLREDESIRLHSVERQFPVRYTPELRRRLVAWEEQYYEDFAELLGEVRTADLDGLKFSLRLEDGQKVEGKFAPHQESLVTDALRDHLSKRIRVTGHAKFLKTSGKIERFTGDVEIAFDDDRTDCFDHDAEPIWEKLARLSGNIQDGEWDDLPCDLSERLDVYLDSGH